MPYIVDQTGAWENFWDLGNVESSGDLNYLITDVACAYIETQGWNYHTMNSIIGALECAKMEFYRRIAVPYEDIKKDINGDVYPTMPPIVLGDTDGASSK